MKRIIIISIIFGLIAFSVMVTGLDIPGFLKTLFETPYKEGTTIAHNIYLLNFGRTGHEILYTKMTELIMMNPPTRNILSEIFIKLTLPFYVLAIVSTGFYLIFFSGSPAKRANAKSLLVKFVIGMFIISISPIILDIGFKLSESLTYRILNMVDMNIYIEVIKQYVSNYSQLYLVIGQLGLDFGIVFPFLWLWWFVWGTFGILMIRYIILTLWISLFPITVFFYSFNTTHDLGRVMLEQTIVWTSLQVFNACVVVAVALAFIIPRNPESLFIIGPSIGIPFFADFLIFMSAFLLIMAPALTTRLFRNFLP